MRLISRVVSGILIASISLGLLGFAGWRVYSAATADSSDRRTPARKHEIEYPVSTAKFEPRDVTPVLTAYGQVRAWSPLEVRAPADGPTTEVSENFRDGRFVAAGELLFRIDPEAAERRVMDAETAFVQARTELIEAKSALNFLIADEKVARNQLEVRKADRSRKEQLFKKQIVTAAVLEEAGVAVSIAERALAAKQNAILAGEVVQERAQKKLERAEVALNDAKRALEKTAFRAPFAGRLANVSATLGRRVRQDEKLADLIDPAAMEVSFRVRNSDIANLIDPQSADRVAPLPIKARLDLGQPVEVNGVLDRAAATIGTNQGGRTLIARLEGAEASALSPGDFVTVEVAGRPLKGVALVPYQAATDDGFMQVVDAEERLTEVQVTIERRQSDGLVVSNFPAGGSYVTARMPHLKFGSRVKRQLEKTQVDSLEPPALAATATSGPSSDAVSETDRGTLINYVRSSLKVADEYRREALEALSNGTVPRELFDRLQKRIAHRDDRL